MSDLCIHNKCCISTKQCLSSPKVVGFSVVSGIALTALGGLALVGIFYPQSGLGVLGDKFTDPGTYAMLATGVTLLAAAIIARKCCKSKYQQSFTSKGSYQTVHPYYQEQYYSQYGVPTDYSQIPTTVVPPEYDQHYMPPQYGQPMGRGSLQGPYMPPQQYTTTTNYGNPRGRGRGENDYPRQSGSPTTTQFGRGQPIVTSNKPNSTATGRNTSPNNVLFGNDSDDD